MNKFFGIMAATALSVPALLPSPGEGTGNAVLAKLDSVQTTYAEVPAMNDAGTVQSLAQALVVNGASLTSAIDEELQCLTEAVYFEARSEPIEGQLAVAQVVLNRVLDNRYPDSICEVVYQNQHRRNACQFSFACDGQPERAANRGSWETALLVSITARDHGWQDLTGNATHYHAKYVEPYWKDRLQYRIEFGQHIFYREAPRGEPRLELAVAAD